MKHYSSVVTTAKLSPPPRWLATTTEATPPLRFLFSVLGGLSGHCFLKTVPHYLISVWTWTHREISRWQYRPLSPTRPLPHSQTGQQQAAASLGTVLSETVAAVSLSAPSTISCSEQLAHSRTTKPGIHLFPINNPSLDTDRYLSPTPAEPPRSYIKKNTATDRVANSCHRNNPTLQYCLLAS